MTMDELIAKLMMTYACNEEKARQLAEEIMPIVERRRRRNEKDSRRRNHFFRSSSSRRAIYGRDEGHCAMCGAFVPFEEMTVGHLIPVSAGGTSSWLNVQLECEPCNTRKGAKIIPRRESDLPVTWPEQLQGPPPPGPFPLVQPYPVPRQPS